MGILNRSKDVSEQKSTIQRVFGPAISTGGTFLVGVAAGTSYLVGQVSFQAVAKLMEVAATNMGNSLVLAFNIQRFVVGLGQTVIGAAFGTLALQNFSVSGIQSVSLVASGNSLLQLLPGDQIWMSPTGTSGTADHLTVDLVIQAINEIKQIYGSST